MQTITEDYRKQQQILHENPRYGTTSLGFAPLVADLIKQSGARSISDYGAGKKNLLVGLQHAGLLPERYFPYDPAFPEYGKPMPADLVCCIDVLEHVEPDCLNNVLYELATITEKVAFLTIHMTPASKFLPDGRNAHLIQKPTSWWLPEICKHFEIIQLQLHNVGGGTGFWIIAKKLGTILDQE